MWTLYFTGHCDPNPGGIMTLRWRWRQDWDRVHMAVEMMPAARANTVNVAAYYAGLTGIRDVIRCGLQPDDELRIGTDAQLVSDQVNNQCRCKDPGLRVLLDALLEAMRSTKMPVSL